MVEMHNADGDSFVLLDFIKDLLKVHVLDDLGSDDEGKVSNLSDIPPVIAVERSVDVVSQTLSDIIGSPLILTSKIAHSLCSCRRASSRLTVILGLSSFMILLWFLKLFSTCPLINDTS